MLDADTVHRLLGDSSLTEILGHPIVETTTVVETVPYDAGSPATAALYRAHGRRPDGRTWQAFVKVLQHVRHWSGLRHLPPDMAAEFAEMFPWREELTLWEPATAARLPPGLRSPHLLRVVELGDDRVAVWSEDVETDNSVWSDERFSRAALLLAKFGARRCEPQALRRCSHPPDFALQMWVKALPLSGFRFLDDDTAWAHPLLAEHGDLRADLRAAVPLVPQILSRFAGLRHGLPHGDASPQNLLVPLDGSADFVVIDLSFQTPAPLGTDLSQLVVGLAHAGLLPIHRLPGVQAAVLSGYRSGLAESQLPTGHDDIAYAYAGNLLLRSGFTAIPAQRLDDPAAAPLIRQRIELTRFILSATRTYLT